MNTENDIQVSVCVVTYNQENYIAECLESLVTQKTNFKFEIIIGEDCSTDKTRSIVQDYVDKYPDLIVPLFYKKNLGPVGNLKEVYKKGKGKYIAHMDGDDMTLPGKLQKQYDVMEKGYAICSHNVCSINDIKVLNHNFWYFKKGEYDWKFYLKNIPFFAHSSKMFVRNHLIDFINNFEINTFDFELHLESLRFGKIYHIEENLGIYRLDVGVMQNDINIKNKVIEGKIRAYKKSLIYFNDSVFIKKILFLDFFRFFKLYLMKREYELFFSLFKELYKLMRI